MLDFLGPSPCATIGMLPAINTCRVLIATVVFLFAVVTPTHGQDDLPSVQETEAALKTLRGWISQFETPAMEDAASLVSIKEASGVSIILRHSGRVLGMASDSGGDALMLRRAAGKAMNSVLADPAIAALLADLRRKHVDDPDMSVSPDSFRNDLGRKLTIELEVAGKIAPLIGRTIDQLASKLHPGIDGIAVRKDNSIKHTFPSQLRATNSAGAGDPAKLLLNIAVQTGISIKDIGDLPKRNDLALYRFRSITLLQASLADSPVQTVMGDVPVPLELVNRASLESFAKDLSNHLLQRIWPEIPATEDGPNAVTAPLRLGIRGDYSVVADQYKPLTAPPLDQALASFALARYGAAQSSPHATAGALRIFKDLASVDASEENPLRDLAACAGIVLAAIEQPDALNHPPVADLFRSAAERIANSFDPVKGFIDKANEQDEFARGVAPHSQAMIAAAMARLLAFQKRPEALPDQTTIRAMIDMAWRSVSQQQHVSLLPWIGWAERDFASATGQPPAHVDDLRLLCELLHNSRIGSPQRPITPETQILAGGFVLMSESAGAASQAIATAQTARPAAWLVGLQRDSSVMHDTDYASFQSGLLETARFLMQLAVREQHAPTVRNMGRARGGVRTALWDSDQTVPAQALSLIAVTELLQNLGEHEEK